jgi:hypothetical protein
MEIRKGGSSSGAISAELLEDIGKRCKEVIRIQARHRFGRLE